METTDKLAVTIYLRGWRKFRGLSQGRLADMVGLTTASVSQLERGLQGFSHDSLAAYARALECTPADLLTYDPRQRDSFWPLCQAAERLEGEKRQQLYGILSGALAALTRPTEAK